MAARKAAKKGASRAAPRKKGTQLPARGKATRARRSSSKPPQKKLSATNRGPRSNEPSAPPATTVVLRTDKGEVARLNESPRLEQAALAWSYRVRNRIRWNASARGRRGQAQQCRQLMEELGLSREQLEQIAGSGILEVSMPYADEATGRASRILPWEYVLSGATRELRTSALTVVRHLERGGSYPERKSVGKVVVVVSSPGKIAELYDLSDEESLAPERLKPRPKPLILRSPTLEGLCHAIEREQPDIVHVGGVDTHQGAELLEQSDVDKAWDGMLLSDGHNGVARVPAQELATGLNAGRRSPSLVVFNLYHSAARIAALTVAEGAAVALGFQDTFDDLAAIHFIGDFYRAWASTRGDALVAFQAGWEALRNFPKPLTGTGIVLWCERSLVRDAQQVRSQASDRHRDIERNREKVVRFSNVAEAQQGLAVECTPLLRLNYSLLHNRRPLFQRFDLRKAVHLEGRIPNVLVEVELSAGPSPVTYRSTEMVGDLGVNMAERVFIPLTSELPRTLEESLDTGLRVKIAVGEHVVFEKPHRVTMLPINEWVDDDQNRQFLPSFVWPLDPAVRRIITSAQPYLHALADDPSAGFDGYQSVDWELDDPTAGVDHQVAAIWRSLLDLQLGYINPPPTYTVFGQRLRTPGRILEGGRGTCIDLALLLTACLEYVEIFPVIFLLEGHAFPGYWRSEEDWEEFARLGVSFDAGSAAQLSTGARPASDLGDAPWMFPSSPEKTIRSDVYKAVRRQVEQGYLVPLESVWLTTRASFQEAMDDGWDNLADPAEFHSMIDLKAARLAEPPVTPLPLVTIR